VICVHNFPHREVSVKVGVMEIGLKSTRIMLMIDYAMIMQIWHCLC